MSTEMCPEPAWVKDYRASAVYLLSGRRKSASYPTRVVILSRGVEGPCNFRSECPSPSASVSSSFVAWSRCSHYGRVRVEQAFSLMEHGFVIVSAAG